MTEGIDRARDEFFAEAQEILETLSRDLLTLDDRLRAGEGLPPEFTRPEVAEVLRAAYAEQP